MLTEACATYFTCILTEGVFYALLEDKGGDEVAPDLTALKDQKECAEIPRYNRVLSFMVQLRVADSCGGEIGAFGRPKWSGRCT